MSASVRGPRLTGTVGRSASGWNVSAGNLRLAFRVGCVSVALAFTWFNRELFSLSLHSDSWIAMWMLREFRWWQPLIDPLTAGYVYAFAFFPLFVPLHLPDHLLAPHLGNLAHHFVPFAALLACSALVARLVRDSTESIALAIVAMALFLFNSGTSHVLADSAYRHYSVATAFGLAALYPAWQYFVSRRLPAARMRWLSVLFYALALAAKESVAGVPLIIVVLLTSGGASVQSAVRFVVPHALVLFGSLGWRMYVLGGLGGYVYEPAIAPANIAVDVIAMAQALWGGGWAGALGAVVVLVFVSRLPLLWLASLTAVFLPFAMTTPLSPDGWGLGKLLLGIAMFLLLLAHGASRMRWPWRTAAVATAIAFIGLQAHQIPSASSLGFGHQKMTGPFPEGAAIVDVGTFLDVVFSHQMSEGLRRPLLAFISPLDKDLYGAVTPGSDGLSSDTGLVVLPMPPEMFQVSTLDRGVVQLCFQEISEGTRLAFLYRNGATEFFASFPVARRCATFPVSYSIRSLYALQSTDSQWLVHRWDSPFFLDPHPGPS